MEPQKLDRALTALSCGFGNSGTARTAIDTIISAWEEQLGARFGKVECEPESVRFQSDISSIHLRGMGIVPILLLGTDSSSLRQSVSKFISGTAPGHKLPIIACTTDCSYQQMRWRTGLRAGQQVVLSRNDLRNILVNPKPNKQLRRQIVHQIPFRKLIPFTPANPTEGAMFFGRQSELEMLIGQDDVDYALCGRGGIGKTSLLRQSQWVLKKSLDPRAHRMVEVDLLACKPDADAAAQEIAQRVSYTSFSHDLCADNLAAFFRRVRGVDERFRNGPIDLIIDEADSVLANDQHMCKHVKAPRDGYPLLRALRHAKNQNLIRVTICGRSQTKKILDDEENPFHGRMKLLEVRPLDTKYAKQLLFGPLEHLGISVDVSGPELNQLLKSCNGVPLKIHHLGLTIVDKASQQQFRKLEKRDVEEIVSLVPA